MHRTTRLAVVLLPLALAACGGATPTTAPGSSPAAPATSAQGAASAPPLATATVDGGGGSGSGDSAICDLLTDAEVSSATGVKVVDRLTAPAVDGQSACTFMGEGGVPVVSYVETTPESPISPQQGFDAYAGSGEAVGGLGDRAVWAVLPGTEFGSIYVLARGNLYALSVATSDPDTVEQKKQASIELARLVVGGRS